MSCVEIKADSYTHVFSSHLRPIATVSPGDTVVIHTRDAMDGKVSSADDLPSRVLAGHDPNPLTGPLHIEGVQPGDTLSVYIESIEPARDYAVSCFIDHLGGLSSTEHTRTLQGPLPEKTWIWTLHEGEDGLFLLNDEIRVQVPWRPFVGSLGVAPPLEAIASITPGAFGGNMDCAEVSPGNTLYLPVFTEGALFSAGDCHANQGQGELCGVALEIPCRLSVVFGLIKEKPIKWPRIVSQDALMVVGSAKPMEDAARIAYAELVLWLEEEWGFSRWEAYQLLTQVGRLHVANMVNPAYSLVASIAKRYLQRSGESCYTPGKHS